jgi:hypothetical protein
LPLSVAQHSLTVLRLADLAPGPRLTNSEARRELLHDSVESLAGGWDPITPIKPILGEGFRKMTERIQAAIDIRYHLPPWDDESYARHKAADRLAAASEALHVAGWQLAELRDKLGITIEPLMQDPLSHQGFRPWEPWPPKVAASRFLAMLNGLSVDHDDLDKAGTGRQIPW